MLTFELVFGNTAFRDSDPIRQNKRIVMEPISFPNSIEISNQMKSFIFQLLSKSPKNRLGSQNGVKDLIRHEWFTDIDF